MQKWIGRLLLAGTGLAIAFPAAAQEMGEKEAVLALMDKAFAAVTSQDADDWRAIQLAEGTTLSFRADPAGPPGKQLFRMRSNEVAVAGMSGTDHEYIERWTGEPTVLIRGPIAVVWGEYDFHLDGEFLHCGVDSADLVKIDGEWKIANFMWTVERENCPTNMSGSE